jgi:predicted metalloprotease
MRSLRRAAAILPLLLLGAIVVHFGSARANDDTTITPTDTASNMVLGSNGGAQPQTMEEFLTGVTKDVDSYWTKVFKANGLGEPHVKYAWIPAGQTAASACGDQDGEMGDSAAAYCLADDTIYISEKLASDIYEGTLDSQLPGSSQGYGETSGDFAVAYIVAHEYGHQVQSELGLYDKYGSQLPTMAFELQADCYAGTWAKDANDRGELDDGDVDEALNAALAVGDFDSSNPGHHGTPEQREQAWTTGFQASDPSACDPYLDPNTLGDDVSAGEQDPGYGIVEPLRPAGSRD